METTTSIETLINQPLTAPNFTEELTVLTNLKAKPVTISTVDEQEIALGMLRDLRVNIKTAEKKFKLLKDPLNVARNAVLAWEHEVLDPMKALDQQISTANSNFVLAQKRAAEQQERELRAIARQEEERQALERASELEAAGNSEVAEQVIAQQIAAPAPVVNVPVQTAKVAGITSRASYSCRVVDLAKLVSHCLANPALLSMFVQANEVALNSQARSLKEQFVMPGCELVTKYV